MRRASLLLLGLLLACNREAWRSAQPSPAADSLLRAELPNARKLKFTAPTTIIVQRGDHNTAAPTTTDNTKAGQKRGTAATAPGSTATSQPAATPWWVYGLFVAGGIAIGCWVRGWLP
ncbi:hypothetical protein [Hymenobacter aranciens]|nr:hypothetical protein [Hymenobacter sp. ASUV-10]